MPFDPRDSGANCSNCPLGPVGAIRKPAWPWKPVASEFHASAVGAVVALAPGHEEERQGHPLAGKSGAEHNEAVRAVGWNRSSLHLLNLRSCRYGGPDDPASGENERMEGALRKLRAVAVREARGEGATAAEAKRRAEAALLHPAACCRPRLISDLDACGDAGLNLIAYGKEAMEALTGETKAITEIAASPRECTVFDRTRRVMPSVHPAFVIRAPGNRVVYRAALAKARRWWSVGLSFPKPALRWQLPPAELREWLLSPTGPDGRPLSHYVYDIETDGTETLRCRIRCIGIGKVSAGWKPANSLGEVVGISFLDRKTGEALWSLADEAAIVSILEEWAMSPVVKVGHNHVSFDNEVMRHRLGLDVGPNRDTMILAAHWTPDVRRALGILGSVLTDIEDWKCDHEGAKLAVVAATNEELIDYCARGDVAVTAAIEVDLAAAAVKNGAADPLPPELQPPGWPKERPWTLLEVDHFAVEMCAQMHATGILIDQERLEAHETRLQADLLRQQEAAAVAAAAAAIAATGSDRVIREIAGLRDEAEEEKTTERRQRRGLAPRETHRFNPNSTKQLGRLLYDVCEVTPPSFTETGEPSTDEASLQSLLLDRETPPEARSVVKATLRLRQTVLSLGRYIVPLKPWSEGGTVFDETGPGSEAPYDDPGDEGYLYRLHPQWKLGTGVGRLSCGGKVHDRDVERQSLAVHQAPKWLRDVFVAPVGFTFVGADFDQAHPRIIAHLWKIPRLLEAFEKGWDPYGCLADRLFESRYRSADGWGPDGFSLKRKPKAGKAGRIRQLCKTLQLAAAYHAGVATIAEQVWSIPDAETGEPLFGDMSPSDIEKLYEKWMRAEPEWETGWQGEVSLYEKEGCLRSLLFRRKSGSLKDGHLTDVCNARTLMTEADLARRAEIMFTSQVPWGWARDAVGRLTPYGLCLQMHDFLGAVTPDSIADAAEAALVESMEQPVPGFTVKFTAERGRGRRWSET